MYFTPSFINFAIETLVVFMSEINATTDSVDY